MSLLTFHKTRYILPDKYGLVEKHRPYLKNMSQEDIKKLLDDGSACFQSGDMDKAISLFEEALKLDPQKC